MDTDRLDEALALHRESVVIDTHCDSLGRVIEGQRRLGERSTLGQFDFPRALEGGLTAEFMATFFNPPRAGTGARQTLQFIDTYYEEISSFSSMVMPATKAEEVLTAKEQGKVALILSMEGAEGLEGDLSVLRICHRLGLRFLGLTWNRRNEAADGLGEIRTGGGLTEFGVQLVKECNRLGIVVDLAHLSPAGVTEVLELADLPVVVTHANCFALWPHNRNLTDAQLEAVAAREGVVGVTAVPRFLGEDPLRSRLDILLDHVDHMMKVIGEDHIGLGMDFDGIGEARTEGISEVSQLPNLTAGLVGRGYSPGAISKILGQNFLRIIRHVS